MNIVVPQITVRDLIWCAICWLLVTGSELAAQNNVARKQARKEASRFLTYLELPARRTEGAMGLLRIGEHAVPTLMRGALHPDPAIACMSMQILGELGTDAMVAEGTLHKLSLSKDPVIASAGGWAKIRVRNQGAILVTDYTKGRLLEYTPTKDDFVARVVLTDIKSAWDAERLGNGNYLVTQYQANRVVEYDTDGKKIWEFKKLKAPLDADRLANGNTLISDTQGGRVIEVNPQGKIVWSCNKLKQPYDADRLVDGNTLITEYGKRVTEVDATGKIVWEHTIGDAFGADRLPNGNTLITAYSSREVIELDAKGTLVFTISGLNNPSEARRLANGQTAVAESDAVRIFDAEGKELRKIALGTRPGSINFH